MSWHSHSSGKLGFFSIDVVKSGSTPVGGVGQFRVKADKEEGQRFGQRLAQARVVTNWIQ